MSVSDNNYFLAYNESLLGDESGPFLYAEKALKDLAIEIVFDIPDVCDQPYKIAILKEHKFPQESLVGLREMLSLTQGDAEFALLSAAAQVAMWHASFKYCPRCATELSIDQHDLAKVCGGCGHHQYPRLSPCIIVLVSKGDKCLLAHSGQFKSGLFSTLAGFIEAGETAEHAVQREVKEEVGIDVHNIEYVCSQSWPFPHSFMLGFMADYAGGELAPDGEEILEAQWFGLDELPQIPPRFTISRRLIDKFIQEQSGGHS